LSSFLLKILLLILLLILVWCKMGKRIIQQARGKGGPAYKSRSFAFFADAKLPPVFDKPVNGRVIDIVKCPGHYAPLVVVDFENDHRCVMQAPEFISVGDSVASGPGVEISEGNVLPLKDIPEGTPIFNIELSPGDGGKICRSSGSFSRIVSKSADKVVILLPSKKEKIVNNDCRACVGVVAGGGRQEKPFLKAGAVYHAKRARNKLYPRTRGSAQNAVDHPFGNKRTARKAKQKASCKFNPPGKKVGKLWPKRTGKR